LCITNRVSDNVLLGKKWDRTKETLRNEYVRVREW